MKLSPESIREYQQIHFAEFGEEITEREAEASAERILSLFQYIFNHEVNEQSSQKRK